MKIDLDALLGIRRHKLDPEQQDIALRRKRGWFDRRKPYTWTDGCLTIVLPPYR